MSTAIQEDEQLMRSALERARDTRHLTVERAARHQARAVFESEFGSSRAIVVADENTYRAAGRDVAASFAGRAEEFVFGPHVYANWDCIEELTTRLQATDAVAIAVGSGTINDLTKLSSHHVGRPYMIVGTAASMDGYTAYGASITRDGSKSTFACPAPRAVVADLDVMAVAPVGMNASGYADLLAKNAAGGDWLLADAAGVEPINADAWSAVQGRLRAWVGNPAAMAAGEPLALRQLVYGLMISGFAMQAMQSSRPASGADHQFSHLWDMQHHKHNGVAPSHGFKVGIGTLSSLALHERLLETGIPESYAAWPALEQIEARIKNRLEGELAGTALKEMRAKYAALSDHYAQLSAAWPELAPRLRAHLFNFAEARDMLKAAGAPFEPEQIGISRERLRASYELAWFIRRRFTVLDVAARAGLMDAALDHIFSPAGQWGAR